MRRRRSSPERKRKAALRRERNRRYRQREHDHVVTFTGEIDDIGTDWLIKHGYWPEDVPESETDVRKVRTAIGKAVTLLLKVSSR